LESPHNSLQNEPKIAKNGSLSSSMHTTEVLFKFLKFLPLWLLMANKACKISKKPALKKPNGHSKLNRKIAATQSDMTELFKLKQQFQILL